MRNAVGSVRRRIAPPKRWDADIDVQDFSSTDALEFRFFQFNEGNTEYFFEGHPKLDVKVEDLPHFRVARAAAQGDESLSAEARDDYCAYLRASWPSYGLSTADSDVDAKYARYVGLVDVVAAADSIEPVLLTTLPGDDRYFVVDGNHRSSVASALGLNVPAKVLSFQQTFDHFMQSAEFYGTGNKQLPYQSIYVGRRTVRPGRRDDIFDRLALVPADLLHGSTVVDVGANIGMNAIAANQTGAATVVGLEVSQKMVNYATRLAVFNDCYPDVSFQRFDVDSDTLDEDRRFDIACMFSIHNHLASPVPLAVIARDHVREAVLFECHPGTDIDDYQHFIDAVGFSSMERVGALGTSVFDRRPSRPLWVLRK